MGFLRLYSAACLAVLAWAVAPATAVAEPAYPIVVELFTSQGCNSCPPADAYLGSLKGRRNIIALSHHVNYWDYLGWNDTFASEEGTLRQRRYAKTLGERTIYTPQIVVGGVLHEVGSRQKSVNRAIRKIAAGQRTGEFVEVSLVGAPAGKLTVRVAEGQVYNRRVAVWLMIFDGYHEVQVERGENGGRTLGYHNVVRHIREIGEWYGEELSVVLDVSDLAEQGEAVAVVVQEDDTGRILGAQQVQLAELPPV